VADIQKALRQSLTGESSITALLVSATAVHYDKLPPGRDEDILPAIVIRQITGEDQRHLLDEASLARTTIQVDCYALGRVSCNALAKAVKDYADNFGGGTLGTGGNQVTVSQIYAEPANDGVDFPSDGSQETRPIRSRDLIIWHTAGG